MKTCFLLATLLLGTAIKAYAADPAFTPEQKQQIIQVIRDAMKADPSILRDAAEALQAADELQAEADTKKALAGHRQDLTANPADPVAGNPAGNVTLVEFYDPRCPYCKRMLPSIEALLAKDHGIRLIYKDIPVLGPASVTEVRAILAAQNQGGYLKMQSALMHSAAQPTDQLIRQAATGLGLDATRIASDMNSDAVSKRIEANMILAKTLKVQGTPVFIVGDTVIPGAVELPQLEAAIAEARKQAVN